MIKEFVARYVVLQDFIEAAFINKRPEGYEDVLKTALTGWELSLACVPTRRVAAPPRPDRIPADSPFGLARSE